MDLKQQLQETLGTTYALERELGGGGMSRVFVADERRLNRKVVIKVLSPELAAGVSGERFEREIQLAASLQQANIVPILAAGETQGLPFYTMPFVEGESMRARVAKDGALPISSVVGILRDVARALSYAHERGVVHRDIKPDNVLLSGGTAVVTDFGIAKAISAARQQNEGATLTQLGTSIGTPAYMSPEQAAGDPSVDHRADIYSLGCMAYELLTGQAPFAGRTPARMLAAHMTEAPKPLADVRSDAPTALADLVMRMLEKDPATRPQSGQEIIQALDTITSSNMAAMSGALIGGPGMLKKTLLWYAAAFVIVAIVARAAIIALGLPDWVLPGALVVMLLGLPVIFFTWYVSRTLRRLATVTPALTPGGSPVAQGTMATLALKASPHVSWRRTWMGGAAALAVFVLVVGGFMLLRALGIGPAGSLLAAGRLNDRERVIVTEFTAPDTSLSTLVTEAVRTNLGQSRAISILPQSAIGGALQRMQRPSGSRIDLALAREIAAREGVKVIVDGSVRSIGADYVVSMRLVSADSANELAAFQETASGASELLAKIDVLTRKLRGRIGESLRDVRGSPPLEQVTTPSLEALRIYAEASRSMDRGGSPLEAIPRLQQAVKLDTGFAMAWRKLGVALSNSNLPRARIDSALGKAYALRDRLTERERLLAEGTYYQLGPGRDRREAIRAYEALLAIDPNESGAANNLGSILSGRRDFARAESLFKVQIASGRATSQNYTNLLGVQYTSGKLDEAQKTLVEFGKLFPASAANATLPINFIYQRGDLDSLEKALKSMTRSENVIIKINGVSGLANYSLLRGKLGETIRYGEEAQRLSLALGGQPSNIIADSLQFSWMDLMWHGDTARAVRRMDGVLTKSDIERLPWDQRPYAGLAIFYASAGRIDRARFFMARDSASVPNEAERRIREPNQYAVQGYIARSEGRYEDAIRNLWRADTTYDGPNGNCAVCLYDDIASTYAMAGQVDSAIHYFELFRESPYLGKQNFEAAQRALNHRRLGELYEQKGNVQKAAENYRAFIEIWKNADAPLQPQVAEVRRKLSRLADVEGKR
jgi:tetratricopeptide (TPR) repeat protein/tRNA A-37 threonylcarbamoyl transferase component Bud32/TolB-like protein